MQEKENLDKNTELWKKVDTTDPNFTRSVGNTDRHFTTINAYYQTFTATQLWGSYGSKWGLKNTEWKIHQTTRKIDIVLYKATFYYPLGEFEINNSICIDDDEFMKKLETDTLTKALSRLGFNADVFMGYFDDNRYVQKARERFNDKTGNQLSPPTTPSSTTDTGEKPAPASANQTPATAAQNTEMETPDIAAALKQHGLNLIVQNGIYVVQGKGTYAKKSVIKSLGFQYSSEKKAWWKQCSAG